MELPDESSALINNAVEKTELDAEYLTKAYLKIINSDHCKTNMKTDDQRHAFARTVLRSRFILRPMVKKYQLIPVGYDAVFLTSKNKYMSAIYGIKINPETNLPEMTKIIMQGEIAKTYNSVVLDSIYEILLTDSKNNVYFADTRTKFDKPKLINTSVTKILEQLKIPQITIKNAAKNLSGVDTAGNIEALDLRVIRGVVRRTNVFSKNGTDKGVVNIIDDSYGSELKVNENNYLDSNDFGVWCAKEFCDLEEGTTVDCYGTTRMSENAVSMNCIRIVVVSEPLPSDIFDI